MSISLVIKRQRLRPILAGQCGSRLDRWSVQKRVSRGLD